MKRLFIITFLGIIGILLLIVIRLFQEKSDLEAKVAELSSSQSPQTIVPSVIVDSKEPLTRGDKISDRATKTQSTSEKGALWRAKRDVDEIKELATVSEEEERSLIQELENSYLNRGTSSEASKIIEGILGQERLREIESLRDEEQTFAEEKEVTDRAIVLSSALSLNESQKEEVRKTLSSVARELKPDRQVIRSSMREMMALHFDDSGGKEELQYRFDEMKTLSESYRQKRMALIADMLRSTLSKDQLAKLTALESDRIEGR